ncbi:DNAse I-like superfamily protein isoform X2 [Carex rostrata]
MRFFISMSSNPGFKTSGRGGRWHRSYSDRPTGPTQQPSPLTNGTPNASSEPLKPNSRPDGPRGPRPYTGHYYPPLRGRGPAYSHRPSPQDFPHPSTHFYGPPAPGPGHSHQRPSQFHGQGPPYMGPQPQLNIQQYYNRQYPPQWYRIGAPNGMYRQTNASQHKEKHQRPAAVNKVALYRRKWMYPPSRVPPQCERFRLLSYNILADYLAIEHSKLYSHLPFDMLSWQWRMNNLLFEFQLWSPDVLCLQEVDRFPDLQTVLESRGYSGIWKIRTGNAIDGCAIFWRTNRFKLLHHEYIEFRPLGLRDNVAQICVLESVVQRTSENDSTSTGTSSSRVVVCNIHVLFNPKRGDIKLGQVRTLIDQALTVSKGWGDAPVVLCGDFNATPNSPLYKFILEQKLDLSGLARSQISGQETGNALASVPGNHKFPRSSFSIDTMNGNRESIDQNAGTGSGTSARTTSSSPIHSKDPDVTKGVQSSEKEGLTLSTESDATEISDSIGNDHVVEPIQEAIVPLSMDFVAAQGLQKLGNDSSGVISSNYKDPLIEKLHLGEVNQSKSLVEDNDNVKDDFINTTDSIAVIVKQPEETHIQKKNETICTDIDASQESQKPEYTATSTNSAGKNSDSGEISQAETLRGDYEIFKGNCVIDSADEENPEPNFLSELQGTQDEFGFKWTQDEFASEMNNSPEIIGGSSNSYPPYNYDPYKWTPDEIKAATGSEDCTFVEHGLKLRSVYTDVEDHDGTKGSHGEPEATSYNQNFLGTVDYTWRSEGLKTVRVLDTIPKHILQETKGFPTKKWGSDHIALVCELAFTNK